MDSLVHASLAVRRLIRRGHGLAIACALAAYVVAGGASTPPGPLAVAALAVWALLLGSRLRTKLTADDDGPLLVDVEIGALLVVGLDAALLRWDGGLSGRFAPSVYLLVALLAAFGRPVAGLAVALWVLALEAAIRVFLLGEHDLDELGIHAAFVGAFAVLNVAFLRAEVARIRSAARARVEVELDRLKQDARSYRLLGAGEATEAADSGGGERSEDRLARSSVEEIHQSVHYALDLLRRSLDLHTAVLLWLNDAGTHLRISELSTAADDVHDAPFAAGDGVMGAVLAQRARVSLSDLKASYKVPYYAGPCPVRALAAIPVLDGESLRGVLVVDRKENRRFSPHEEEIVERAARFCLRAIQNERVFVQLERAKVEQGKLYRAAQALGAALSEKDVLEAGVKAAREVASFDLAAVTIFDPATRTHEICAAKSAEGEIDDLVGVRFSHNSGLVSMVVQNRYPLPYRGDFDPSHQVVLNRRLSWPKYPSLLVLPLLMHDRALGSLILGAKRRHAFGDSVRPTLEVLASHLAVSLSNARMVHKLETMATTDGLTGLLNKRAMLAAGMEKIAAAARFRRKLSLVVCDIDFFKKVNDNFGHDVGDLVIRGLGEILKRQKRTTDVVARFGGEEFVVLCEQTDEKGAMLLAERIREELKKTTFRTPKGELSVTCSLGVATFPEGGDGWDALFKAADEALYVSKRSGRDRATAWHAHRPAGAPAAGGVAAGQQPSTRGSRMAKMPA
jgi:diguanylate cyclase (GGDEF)-like protein